MRTGFRLILALLLIMAVATVVPDSASAFTVSPLINPVSGKCLDEAGGTVRISRVQVTNNTTGLNPSGGGLISSYGTNNITANGAGNGPPNGPAIVVQ